MSNSLERGGGEAQRRSREGLRARGMLLAAALFVVLGFAATFAEVSYREYLTTFANAERNANNMSRTLEQHAARLIGSVDQLLAGVGERLAVAGPPARQAENVRDFLRRRLRFVPHLRAVDVLDRGGVLRASSDDARPVAIDRSDDPAFRAHLGDVAPHLYVGAPVQDPRDGTWTLPMSRPIFDRNGIFDGVAVARLDIDYFEDFYGSLDVGPNGRIALFRRDGVVLTLKPLDDSEIGHDFAAHSLFRDQLPRAESGFFTSTRPGVEHLIAYRAIPGMPLVIAVVLDRGDVFLAWRRNVTSYAIAVAAIIAITLLVARLLAKQWGRRDADALELGRAQANAEQAYTRFTERTRQFDIALDNITQGLVLHDGEDRLVVCNRRYIELFDLPADVVRPGVQRREILDYILARDGADAPAAAAIRDKHLRLGTSARRQIFFQRLAGSRVVEVAHQPVPGFGSVQTYTDVTARLRTHGALRDSRARLRERVHELEQVGERLARKGAELRALAEDLAHARDEAEAASRTKSNFLAHMSHELRTPLNAIIGFSEVMKDEVFGAIGSRRYRDYAQDVYDSGTHLLALINEILDLAKVESGRLELRETEIDLAAMMAACHRLMKERAGDARVELITAPAPLMPRLFADEIRVKQILLNLLANAVKFTPPNGRITLAAAQNDDGGVTLWVSDTGIGMRPEDIPRAMEPFGQVEGFADARDQGTGLGLPLTKALAELHGGAIHVESARGVGTTVYVSFPSWRSRLVPLAVESA